MTDATQEAAQEAPTQDAPVEAVAAAAEAADGATEDQKDPSIVGELDDAQKGIFANYKRNQNTGVLELGQLFLRGFQICQVLEDQKVQFKEFSKALVESMGLTDDTMQYQLLGNGQIRGIKNPDAPAAPAAPAAAAPEPMSEGDAKVAQLQAALEKAKAEANGAAKVV